MKTIRQFFKRLFCRHEWIPCSTPTTATSVDQPNPSNQPMTPGAPMNHIGDANEKEFKLPEMPFQEWFLHGVAWNFMQANHLETFKAWGQECARIAQREHDARVEAEAEADRLATMCENQGKELIRRQGFIDAAREEATRLTQEVAKLTQEAAGMRAELNEIEGKHGWVYCPACGSCGIGGCCDYFCDACADRHDGENGAENVGPLLRQENASLKAQLSRCQARLDAYEAAKEGEPGMPNYDNYKSDNQYLRDVENWALTRVAALKVRVEDLERERKWIRCSERMPEKGQDALLYFDASNDEAMIELGYVSFQTIGEYTGDDEFPWDSLDANAAYEDGARPRHWMPLPEPPAELRGAK